MPRYLTPSRCENCQRDFMARRANVDEGRGKYCSRGCANSHSANRKRLTVAERFWSKVDKVNSPHGCWLWRGWMASNGYGGFAITATKTYMAHRFAWMLTHPDEPIPDDIFVCHNCPGGDNPRCVNPAHMFLGTQGDNVRDARSKGRMRIGEESPKAKLTADQVREIRARYAAGGVTLSELGIEFGIHWGSVWAIIRRISWKHLP